MFDYPGRIERLRTAMTEADLDAVLLAAGPDLPYFTGYEAQSSERLTMFVMGPDLHPTLYVPRLEAPRVEAGPFDLAVWEETEDPVSLVARFVRGTGRVAVGDQTWSVFLMKLQAELPKVVWSAASEITRELRIVKDPAELEALHEAANAVDRVLARVPGEVTFRGRTEREVARRLADLTVEEGHDTAAFSIIASGPNGASPHHVPTDRLIRDGDAVVCDFGGRRNGYYSDVTRTFIVGSPTSEQEEAQECVLEANEAARRAVAPGVPCEEVDRVARAVIEEAGFGEFFIHRTGHGIGLEVHEHPYIVEGNRRALEPGMTFSVEPGVYLPGRFGVRIEDIVACGLDGAQHLNQAERRLIEVR